MADKFDDLANSLATHEPKAKKSKATRTMSLEVTNYKKLQEYCKKKNKHIGEVIDDLIDMLVKTLEEKGELLDISIEPETKPPKTPK